MSVSLNEVKSHICGHPTIYFDFFIWNTLYNILQEVLWKLWKYILKIFLRLVQRLWFTHILYFLSRGITFNQYILGQLKCKIKLIHSWFIFFPGSEKFELIWALRNSLTFREINWNKCSYFLVESKMRRLKPHSCLFGKYEATASSQLA